MASGVRSGRLIRASYALQSAASLTVGDPCCPGWWSTVRVDLADVGAGVGDRLLLDIGVQGTQVNGLAQIYRLDEAAHSRINTVCIGIFVSRSEEHTSELQSLMRISYAVFCLK